MTILIAVLAGTIGAAGGALVTIWWRNRPEPPECMEPFNVGGLRDQLRCYLRKGHKGPHR